MKHLFILLILLCLPGVGQAAELGTARFSLLRGDVQVYTDDTQEWVPATVNFPLKEGDRVWVPDGARAEIHIQGGIYLRLDAQSSLDILSLGEESFQFNLQQGHAYINNRKGGIDHIQVDTPLSSIGGYDNSLIMIDVADSGATTASVLKGSATAETRGGKTRLAAGNALRLLDDLTAELFPLGQPDAWERWNRRQDQRLADAAESLRYLPDELDDYAAELDANGSWVHAPEYGYVWTPRVTVLDWAPYHTGRWVWVRGDYVWVSYDPWGWAPHHYGRWVQVSGHGWCWVPPARHAVHWGPGFVGWVHTESHVAWVPLAPGEVYYGRGSYGPGSVNIAVNRTVARQEFRNLRVRNAVSVIHRETFLTGRRVRTSAPEQPFRHPGASFGPPAFRGERATAAPTIRSVPRERRPPARFQAVPVEQVRRERRIIREEKGSVFRPERPAPALPVQNRVEPLRPDRPQQPPPVKSDRDHRRTGGRSGRIEAPAQQQPAQQQPAQQQPAQQQPVQQRPVRQQPAQQSPAVTPPGPDPQQPAKPATERRRGQRQEKQQTRQPPVKGEGGRPPQERPGRAEQPRERDGEKDNEKSPKQRGRDRD